MIPDVTREREHLFLGTRLKRLAEQMQGDVTQLAQQAGIPVQPGQYPLLATIEANGPQTVSALARALGMSQPAATKAVERLRRAGLVAGGRGPARRAPAPGRADGGGPRRSRAVEAGDLAPRRGGGPGDRGRSRRSPPRADSATIEARLAERPLSRRAAEPRSAWSRRSLRTCPRWRR